MRFSAFTTRNTVEKHIQEIFQTKIRVHQLLNLPQLLDIILHTWLFILNEVLAEKRVLKIFQRQIRILRTPDYTYY